MLALSWEERDSSVQLSQDAAERPHVYSRGIRNAQNDLWSPVEPGLDVSVNPLIGEAARPKVDDLDARLIR